MNKFTTMIAAAASLVIASVASTTAVNAGAVLDKVLETKTLTVAVGTDWGTMSFLNDKHELDGYDVEVAKGIAEYLGAKVEFVTPSWDIITSGKWEGRWDVAMGQMVPTKARAEKLDFPAVYFYSRNVAIIHKDSNATKLSDLDGTTIGVPASTVHEYYAKHTLTPDWIGAQPTKFQFTPGEVKTYPTGTIAFDDLRLGGGVRLDAVLGTQESLVNSINAGFPVKQLGEPLFSSPAAIAILLGDKEFSDKIAATIQKMKDDGRLSTLSMKWYGVDHSVEK
ncbi:transporter substrate-binding domain-containing protein [Mesorhizobium sp.]|uniref:transporter substrate-binding domain-containing protein n=1 Tax=Mesorhizobium sp. TaxID=1871066 RepID=UPI0012102017|nr:transporter substrate-binding domain-containing protein [Mesorhizobium sp.]TIO32250.1 MAG: transporter substrate-binding domain-containing protein [Mesorhizobium sp.]TIQ02883.1 MAG: transporter substrate-binding domain-containing protein [Mesorhizobium sp.]